MSGLVAAPPPPRRAPAGGPAGATGARFAPRGYILAAIKMLVVDVARAKEHYAEHDGKPFFNGLVEYITSAPIVALVVQGSDAIEGCRSTIGATNPIKAAPGSIRGDYAQTIGRNLVHGSDSAESAAREIKIWFAPEEIFARASDAEKWLISN